MLAWDAQPCGGHRVVHGIDCNHELRHWVSRRERCGGSGELRREPARMVGPALGEQRRQEQPIAAASLPN
jgi:hypothetical protein